MLPEYIKPSEFTNWALTSESLEWISQFVEAAGIRKVVECGSGLSTILFGSFKLEKVLSLEHNSNWYTYTRQRLQEKGLLEYVDLQLCQLQESILNGNSIKWYDINNVSSFAADLILVDGPPQESSLRARYPAPHLLKAFIQPGTWLLLDDYYRDQETEIVNLWLKEIPELELIKVAPFKHGLAVLRYKGSSEYFIENAQEAPISEPSNLIKLNRKISSLEKNQSSKVKEAFLSGKSLRKQELNISKDLIKKSVSIVITVYNRENYLAAAIKSVLAQTWSDFELLIWDDGSTDRSVEIASEYAQQDKRIRVIAAQHTGIAPAIHGAVAATTGDYIGWVDSDDILAPTALEQTISILNNHPLVGLVYTDYQLMDEQGNLHGIGQRCQIPYSKERLLVDFMTFHFRLIRRTLYDQVGGIDPNFLYAEEYDLCLKLSEVTDFYHIAQPLYYYRRHSSNLTNEQYEPIRWSQKAITNALKRRGLDIQYELSMQLVAYFSIKPKHTTKNTTDLPQQIFNSFPTVSIIIPTYNRKHYLGHALESIRYQTYTNYEIIVIDDGSTDGTADWIQTHYPQVKLLQIPTNTGAAAARNLGIKNALGQFIAFLDSDDQWLPDYLQHQIDTLKQTPTAVLSYCNYIAITSVDHKGDRMSLSPSHPDDLILSMLWRCFIHTLSQVVVPKSVFQTVGLLNEQLKGCHDWEFYLRLFAYGTPVHIPYYLVRKRWLPDSIVTQSNCTGWLANGLQVLEEFYRRPANACYSHLRPTIETHFRTTVEQFKSYIFPAFNQNQSQSITTPLVSIIISSDNASRFAACLYSCQQQIYPNLEIIIVEHDSTENLSEISRQFASTIKGRVIFTQCQQAVASSAYNHGLALATGDYIQWLDGSDELTPKKIALQVAALEQNRQFDIAYGDWQWCFYQNEQCQLRIAFAFQQNDDERMQRLMHNWQPLHAFLIRRSTAVRLQELQVWNYPETQLDADREYLTLAAIVGFRFLHVQHSTVLYNHFSSSQMILSDSYVLRVERLKQMFLRFQYHATMQPLGEITEQHWFLLKQSWDLWKLAPVTLQQHGEEAFFLQHSQKELGMPLNLAQARIVSALYKSDEACTLEDHARKIVRLFWKQIVQQPGGEGLNVAAELTRWVGLAHPEISDSDPRQLAHTGSQSTSLLQAKIDAIPLSAPLFVEQKLAVLYVLDKLRTAGMLNQFSDPQSQVNQLMPAR
ncbi:glycosyltransferase [Nostoc sp. NMS4]|uniref:glycosyltransferase n=1 Tax=Nostoc sp. NMS4 TaxID=2815390 RepID=UPI0025E54BE3|nr:glycosyltransferase [Nostoc sp. NMS4]MBN3925619.1 glycosyltransferase [Nostoc sp. NMS4]